MWLSSMLSTIKRLWQTHWRDMLRAGISVLGPAAVLFFWAQHFHQDPEIAQSMLWMIVTIITVTQTTVGKAAKKGCERSMGTITGGLFGLLLALTRSPVVMTVGCVATAMIGELIVVHLKLENTGMNTHKSFVFIITSSHHHHYTLFPQDCTPKNRHNLLRWIHCRPTTWPRHQYQGRVRPGQEP
eukprot:GHUV01009682.1.p1 GENE.GHUV01009682.1~~GHUV01009682.1.p1  ORF type:complete len:185 (+),score=20.75 GHUV01009682.1:301-855(+)